MYPDALVFAFSSTQVCGNGLRGGTLCAELCIWRQEGEEWEGQGDRFSDSMRLRQRWLHSKNRLVNCFNRFKSVHYTENVEYRRLKNASKFT